MSGNGSVLTAIFQVSTHTGSTGHEGWCPQQRPGLLWGQPSLAPSIQTSDVGFLLLPIPHLVKDWMFVPAPHQGRVLKPFGAGASEEVTKWGPAPRPDRTGVPVRGDFRERALSQEGAGREATWGHSAKAALGESKRKFLPELQWAGTLILNLHAPELLNNRKR